VTGRKAGGCYSASPAWGFEQGGDLSDRFGAWADVPHRGARVAVPGLGHDQLQGDALLTEVGRCGAAELVQLPPGVPGEQDPGAVIAEPGPSGGRAQVRGRGAAGGAGAPLGAEHRPGLAATVTPGHSPNSYVSRIVNSTRTGASGWPGPK
jgi:hypothetical protein